VPDDLAVVLGHEDGAEAEVGIDLLLGVVGLLEERAQQLPVPVIAMHHHLGELRLSAWLWLFRMSVSHRARDVTRPRRSPSRRSAGGDVEPSVGTQFACFVTAGLPAGISLHPSPALVLIA
jgi:hypothetical protein